jgi:hypothetical protein
VDRIEAAALVRAVEQLYRGDLVRELRAERGLSEREVDVLRLSRSIVDAASHFRAREPERLERLWQRIQGYRALLAEYRVRDDAVRVRIEGAHLPRRIAMGWTAVLGLPVFAYGYLVNALPFYVPRWLARHTARKETDYATTRLLASIAAYPVFWSLEAWMVGRIFGISWVLPFALSLPVTGLLASRYLVGAGRLRRQLRLGLLALRHGAAARQLVAERMLMAELGRAEDELPRGHEEAASERSLAWKSTWGERPSPRGDDDAGPRRAGSRARAGDHHGEPLERMAPTCRSAWMPSPPGTSRS